MFFSLELELYQLFYRALSHDDVDADHLQMVHL